MANFFLCSFVMLLLCVCHGLSITDEDISTPASSEDTGIGSDGQEAIKEMVGKLDRLLSSQASCLQDASTARHASVHDHAPTPRPCIDLVSGQSVLTQLCDRLTSLEDKMNRVTSEVHSAHSKSDGVPASELARLRTDVDTALQHAAFSGTLETSVKQNWTQTQLSGFTVKVNSGHGFDANTGVFKAPYKGVYYISLTYLKSQGAQVTATLVLGGQEVGSARDEEQAHYDTMLQMGLGQELWVEASTEEEGGEVEEEPFTYHNLRLSLTGMLVH